MGCLSESEIEFYNEIENLCDIIQNYDYTLSRFRYPCDKKLNKFRDKKMFERESIILAMKDNCIKLEGLAMELAQRNECMRAMIKEYEYEYW